jgi:hypothetical protein
MKKVAVIAVGVVLATALPAAASHGRSADTLQLVRAGLSSPSFAAVGCPSGAPAGADCWAINGAGEVPGLGAVSESGVLVVAAPHTSCEVWQSTPVLTVTGKGTIELFVHTPAGGCLDTTASTGAVDVTQVFTVTGGTGAYADASGSGSVVTVGILQVRQANAFAGTLVAPSATFDLTPPVIAGASARVVRAPKGKRAVRVRFAVSAQDDVAGPVAASCMPASGSSFRIGHTRVTCTATDSSANTATATFTITVKR